MTIWSGRTQHSIASGFAAASVSGNRTLRSVVPSGRRVLHSVAAPVGAATPTPSCLPEQKKTSHPPSCLSAQEMGGNHGRNTAKLTLGVPSPMRYSRSVWHPLCATHARRAVRVPHDGG